MTCRCCLLRFGIVSNHLFTIRTVKRDNKHEIHLETTANQYSSASPLLTKPKHLSSRAARKISTHRYTPQSNAVGQAIVENSYRYKADCCQHPATTKTKSTVYCQQHMPLKSFMQAYIMKIQTVYVRDRCRRFDVEIPQQNTT